MKTVPVFQSTHMHKYVIAFRRADEPVAILAQASLPISAHPFKLNKIKWAAIPKILEVARVAEDEATKRILVAGLEAVVTVVLEE
jgi:hypothetical protein